MKVKFRELNTGVERTAKRALLPPGKRIPVIVALTLIVVFLIVYIGASVGVLPAEALGARISAGLLGSGKNFPQKVDSSVILNMSTIGNQLLILTDQKVTVLNPSGQPVYEVFHNFDEPAVSVNGRRAVLFDRGGTAYQLLTDKKAVGEMKKAPGNILTAVYGDGGNYALGCRADGATSALYVYSRHGKNVFAWKCSEEHIDSVALSADGKYAGVCALGTKDGSVYTAVHYFGFDYKEPLNSQTLSGTAGLKLSFTTAGRLTVFGDNGIFTLKKKGKTAESVASYYASELNSFSLGKDGKYVLALSKYGSTNQFELVLYSASGKEKQRIAVDSEISSVCMSDKYIFALAEKKILVYNLFGSKVGDIEVGGELYAIYPTDRYCYLYSLDAVNRCYSYGKSSVELGYAGY